MNRLNKIFTFILFFSVCLLFNVSYATFSETVGSSIGSFNVVQSTTTSGGQAIVFGDYNLYDILSYAVSYAQQGYADAPEAVVKNYRNAYDYLTNNGYSVVVSGGSQVNIFISSANVDFGVTNDFNATYVYANSGDVIYFAQHSNGTRRYITSTCTGTGYSYNFDKSYIRVPKPSLDREYLCNVNIKNIQISNGIAYWDGTYYYKVESDEPDTPSFPSNSEIASAVQMFYNSVYNLPNVAFDDFIVLYDNTTKLYTYIGHTLETALGQVIVEPNGYYEGIKYDVQWWKFFIDEQNDNFLDQFSQYYVYSSEGTIDTLKLVGNSKIDGLINSGPWATSNTIIVYSTNDYPVKYITFSEESPDPIVETGTIKGDQYTYDENIDITDNQYNPLDNFVSVDYPSSLVSRADFDKFMETFNENKDFLILPSDSKWIIIACESLFGYFSSFIIMCAVFIIVERIMRG